MLSDILVANLKLNPDIKTQTKSNSSTKMNTDTRTDFWNMCINAVKMAW